MKFIPVLNDNYYLKDIATNGFTLGATYEGIPTTGGYMLINDNGDERYIAGDESLSPHIVLQYGDRSSQECVGYFKRVE